MMAKVIHTVHDEAADAEQLDEVLNFIKTFGDEKNVNEDLAAYRFKGKKQEDLFLNMFGQMIMTMQKFLADKGMETIDKLLDSSNLKYLKMRITRESHIRDMIFMVEYPDKAEYKVYMKNLYETHGMYHRLNLRVS